MPPQGRGDTARLKIRVRPRASKDEIAGTVGDAIVVKVAAPPVKGAANKAVVKLLARELNVPKSAVQIVAGERARQKVVEVEGISDAEAKERLRQSCP